MRVVIALLLCALLGQAETLRLGDGRSIEGKVVKETADKVFVDVGFTILEVPKKEIVERKASAKKGDAKSEGKTKETRQGLIRTIERGEASVRENVTRTEGGVVMIRTPQAIGSGFIISPDGYVVTNDHVIQGDTKVWVVLFERGKDGAIERRKASNVKIVAINAYYDLALLKIEDEKPLPFVYVGDSRSLKAGQPVYAIGNPLGLERTVSEGIVSTLNRAIEGLPHLQTTTAVNPGNSGGPLFDLQGRVIGVVNLKIGGAESLNFAIPSERLVSFLKDRDGFAYDKDNPNSGYRYLPPPPKKKATPEAAKKSG
ncbi:MAG: trypsin-like peptidase domain-containing protein [Planctomycetota bacterium]